MRSMSTNSACNYSNDPIFYSPLPLAPAVPPHINFPDARQLNIMDGLRHVRRTDLRQYVTFEKKVWGQKLHEKLVGALSPKGSSISEYRKQSVFIGCHTTIDKI